MASTDIYLLADLTGISISPSDKEPPRSDYGATSLAHDVLLLVGLDVIQFQRNQQVAYRVVERSNRAVKKINGIIKTIAEKKPRAEGDWKDFELYHAGIDVVEQLLLSLAETTDFERSAPRYVSGSEGITECISKMNKWEANRAALREAAQSFNTNTTAINVFKSGTEDTTWQQGLEDSETQDDLAFFSDLADFIAAHKMSRKPTTTPTRKDAIDTRHAIDGINSELADLRASSFVGKSSAFITFALKFAFIVQGVMVIASEDTTENTTVRHFNSKEVWETAHKVSKHISAGDEAFDEHQTLKSRWEEFILLLSQAIHAEMKIPDLFWDLMELPGNIHRPYRARAVALVDSCRKLVELYRALPKATNEQLESLEEAIDQTIRALRTGTGAFSNAKLADLTTYKIADYENDDVIVSFVGLHLVLEACFKSLNSPGEWMNALSKITAAENQDRDAVDQMLKRFKQRPSVNTVPMTVDVITTKGPLKQLTFRVEPQARLAAVRYAILSRIDQAVQTSAKEGIFGDQSGKELSIYNSVKEAMGNDATCALTFTLKDGSKPDSTSDAKVEVRVEVEVLEVKVEAQEAGMAVQVEAQEAGMEAQVKKEALEAQAKKKALEAQTKKKALESQVKKEAGMEAQVKKEALEAQVKKKALEAQTKKKALEAQVKKEALEAKVRTTSE
ncbi:hypothetical protein DL96DRAFT_1687954 [Flagelloscypha sp. PMI_526]|nr:hypothetical protein DL96DRAFT_1687954 [Flagelloscypha sp. PMI_526]